MPVDKPRMTEVASSNISAIGHHAERNELHVTFKNGGHYVYEGVAPHVAEGAIQAKSPGSFLSAHVKGKFKHTKHDA